jgi:chemotaxis protein methyltransferase CheR
LSVAHVLGLTEELKTGYLKAIEDQAGLRLSPQQARRLPQAIDIALRESGETNPERLLEQLRAGHSQGLMDSLAAGLTIGETHFLRVKPQIEALQNLVIPSLAAVKARGRRLAVWSAGCSTGEEPYTLAILLREALPSFASWDVSLLATDISRSALQSAREALYGNWSFRGTPDEYRDHYFHQEGTRWRLDESIRRMVEFVPLNLISDPYPRAPGPGFDVILCRNVTIYFSQETTQAVYARFFERLEPGGWLILGPSDPVPGGALGYDVVSAPGALLWRRPSGVVTGEARPFSGQAMPAAKAEPSINGHRSRIEKRAELLEPAPPKTPAPTVRSGRPASGPGDDAGELSLIGSLPYSRDALEQLVARNPVAAAAHLRLGLLYLDQNEPHLAFEAMRRATFLDPGDAFAQFTLGRSCAQTGQSALANRAFANALRLIENQPDATPVPGTDFQVGDLRHAAETALSRPVLIRGRA